MVRRALIASVLACAVSIFASGITRAEDAAQNQPQPPTYGSHLMSEQERAEHRAQMRAAKNPEERARLRKEHHERMELRANERGVTIPDEPPPHGGGKGPGGSGPGGMGMGGGMGPGGGGNR
jgi:hypothetical protein